MLADFAIGLFRNIERVGDQHDVAAHQRDPCRVHRHVGAAGHRDADVGGGQRGCVVDAITGVVNSADLGGPLQSHDMLAYLDAYLARG